MVLIEIIEKNTYKLRKESIINIKDNIDWVVSGIKLSYLFDYPIRNGTNLIRDLATLGDKYLDLRLLCLDHNWILINYAHFDRCLNTKNYVFSTTIPDIIMNLLHDMFLHFKNDTLIKYDNLNEIICVTLVGMLLEYVTPYTNNEEPNICRLYTYFIKTSIGDSSKTLSSFTCPTSLLQANQSLIDKVTDELLMKFKERLIKANNLDMCKNYKSIHRSVKDVYMNKLIV